MSGTRRRFFQDAAVLGAGLFSLETLRVAGRRKRCAHARSLKLNNPHLAPPHPEKIFFSFTHACLLISHQPKVVFSNRIKDISESSCHD